MRDGILQLMKGEGCLLGLVSAVVGWGVVVFGAAGIMTLLGHHPDDYGVAPLCVIIIGPAVGILAAFATAGYVTSRMEEAARREPREPTSQEFKRQLALLKTDEDKIKMVRQRAERKKWHEKVEDIVRRYGKDWIYEDAGLRFDRLKTTIEYNGTQVYRALGQRIDVALDDDGYTIRDLPKREQYTIYIVHTYLPGEWEELYDQVVQSAAARHEKEQADLRLANIEAEKKRFGL